MLELIFRFIIPAAESPDRFFDKNTNLVKLAPNQEGVFTMGKTARYRSKWRVNNHGWNHSDDYTFENTGGIPRICIIGDSYVEAKHIDVAESMGVILNELLPGYQTYSFGISGAPFSQYLQMARYVARHYQPDVLVVLLVHNDFDQSIKAYKNTPLVFAIRIKWEFHPRNCAG